MVIKSKQHIFSAFDTRLENVSLFSKAARLRGCEAEESHPIDMADLKKAGRSLYEADIARRSTAPATCFTENNSVTRARW